MSGMLRLSRCDELSGHNFGPDIPLGTRPTVEEIYAEAEMPLSVPAEYVLSLFYDFQQGGTPVEILVGRIFSKTRTA